MLQCVFCHVRTIVNVMYMYMYMYVILKYVVTQLSDSK